MTSASLADAPAEAPPVESGRAGWRRADVHDAAAAAHDPGAWLLPPLHGAILGNHPRAAADISHPILVAADLTLALAPSWPRVLAGAGLWGLYMAATQGLLSAIVADTASGDRRGSAFGAFNLAQGLALLLGSAIAGGL